LGENSASRKIGLTEKRRKSGLDILMLHGGRGEKAQTKFLLSQFFNKLHSLFFSGKNLVYSAKTAK